jgi:4-diphosphocytidyl-2-C-methyl-D-erythritol kinase
MARIIVSAYPKINLMLHITGLSCCEEIPLHNLQSIFYFPSKGELYDQLIFDTEMPFSEYSACLEGVRREENSIHSACDLLKSYVHLDFVPHLDIVKKIPFGSGLGGGSSDSALFCRFVMNLNNVPEEEQKEFISKAGALGCDVPIFLAHYITNCDLYHLDGTGIGPDFNQITFNQSFYILLITVPIFCDTKLIYSIYSEKSNSFSLKQDIKTSDLMNFIGSSKNDLQDVVTDIYEDVRQVLDDLSSTNQFICRMSGSGSSCFSLYLEKKDMYDAFDLLKRKYVGRIFVVDRIACST